jgi:hypothetical protein
MHGPMNVKFVTFLDSDHSAKAYFEIMNKKLEIRQLFVLWLEVLGCQIIRLMP